MLSKANFSTYQFMVYSENCLKSENYCEIIDHISGTVIYNMIILLQINKRKFNVRKEIHVSQNLAKILTENCFCFFNFHGFP